MYTDQSLRETISGWKVFFEAKGETTAKSICFPSIFFLFFFLIAQPIITILKQRPPLCEIADLRRGYYFSILSLSLSVFYFSTNESRKLELYRGSKVARNSYSFEKVIFPRWKRWRRGTTNRGHRAIVN